MPLKALGRLTKFFGCRAPLQISDNIMTTSYAHGESNELLTHHFIRTSDKGKTWTTGRETVDSHRNERTSTEQLPIPMTPLAVMEHIAGKELDYLHLRAGYKMRFNAPFTKITDTTGAQELAKKEQKILATAREVIDENHGNPNHVFKAVRDFGDFIPTPDTAKLHALRMLLHKADYLRVTPPAREKVIVDTISANPV